MAEQTISGAGEKILSPAPFMGAVLAGGSSRRMGQNKALMEYMGRPLIVHVIETLEAVLPQVCIVAKDLEPYAFLGRPLAPDLVRMQSPLSGIYSALCATDADYVFVAACDMPSLTASVVSLIISQSSRSDITVPRFGDHYEPLCAVYSRTCLPMIKESIEKDEHRVMGFWPRMRVRELNDHFWQTHGIGERTFMNVNRPEDWPE